MTAVAIVLAQHAEEAAFLWLLRDAAVRAPHYGLADLAALDRRIAAHLDGSGIALIQAGTLDSAIRTAYQRAESGDTILLAPACASFDQFTSYEHRGKVFKDLVHQMAVRSGSAA